MKSDTGNGAIPDLLLERYRLDEVSPAERTEVERQLLEDESVRRRLAEIEASDEAVRESGFTASLAAHLRHARGTRASSLSIRTGRSPASVLRWALPLAVGLTAVVVVTVLGSRTGAPVPDATGDRVKGLRPGLTVFRQTPRGSETVIDGGIARQGDVVRLAYQAAGQSYGVIVSIDGRGGVTVHLPPYGRNAVRLQPGDRILLDNAYELDDAPRWECFYFVTAREPFDAQPVIEAAKREAAHLAALPPPALSVPGAFEQSRFVLRKEHTP